MCLKAELWDGKEATTKRYLSVSLKFIPPLFSPSETSALFSIAGYEMLRAISRESAGSNAESTETFNGNAVSTFELIPVSSDANVISGPLTRPLVEYNMPKATIITTMDATIFNGAGIETIRGVLSSTSDSTSVSEMTG